MLKPLVFIGLFACSFQSVAEWSLEDCDGDTAVLAHNVAADRFMDKAAVVALRCLLEEPDAESILLDISERGEIVPSLYAAIGLWHLESLFYASVADKLLASDATITVLGGDHVYDQAVREIVKAIDSGDYRFYNFAKLTAGSTRTR